MKLCHKKCWILILFVIVTVLQQSCHASRGKRAVPIYPTASKENKGNNSETVSSDKYLKEFWNQHNGGLCPIGQVFHKNKSVCCEIAVCGPDHEIIECASNGTADKCSKCKNNYIQKHNISSLDMADAKCFQIVSNHAFCPGDMRPARKNMHKDNFPLPCECKLEMCYIESDIGSCTLKSMCPPSQQLNKTGSCEPCPWYTYKNVNGCEPCTINKTLLQEHIYITPKVRTTTVKAEERQITSITDQSLSTRQKVEGIQNNKSDELIAVYITLAVIGALVLGTIFVIVGISCYKRRVSAGSRIPPPTPDNVPLITGGQVTLTPTGDGFGNAFYLHNNQGNGYNMTNVGNGHARNLHEGTMDNIGGDHLHENGISDRGQGVQVGMVANGRLSNGNVPNSDQENGVEERSNESKSEQHETEMKTKESDKMNWRKTGKVNLPPASDNLDTNVERHGLEEEYTNGSPEGACGSETHKLDDVGNIAGDKGHELKDKMQVHNNFSIHGNKFENCNIVIGARGTKLQGKTAKISCAEPLTSISGSFGNNSSLKSEDSFGDDETLKQPGRRNGNQVKEKVIEDDCENEGQNIPFCRPELSNPRLSTQEKDIQSKQKDKPDCVEDCDSGEIDLEQDNPVEKQHTKNLLTARSMSVPPLQHSIPTEKPIGRVAPTVRQNSGDEVRHVSGYPSRILDEDSASSGGSMSYAIMHVNSEFNNGYISRDFADTTDFSEVDENESQHSQHAPQTDVEFNGRCASIPYSGDMDDQRQRVRNEAGPSTRSDLQSNLDALPLTRLNGSRINATNPFPPMSQREEPEGDSITYAPVSEPYVSRPDLEQTDRKALMNEIYQNETHIKEVACVSTAAKTLGEDDDITEYKRKIKEKKESGNNTDLNNEDRNNDARGRSGFSDKGESSELTSKDTENKFNVENILYLEEGTIEESSVNKTMESSDKSFEISSKDIDVVESSKKASETATFDDSSDSYEIYANDLKKIEKANDETDDESFVESENRNMLETEQTVDTKENVSTCSGETSFEINSSEVNNLQRNEESD